VRTIADAEWIYRRVVWRDWLDNNFISNLSKAALCLRNHATTQQVTVEVLLRGGSEESAPKEAWQRRITAMLRSPYNEYLQRHLRRRLDGWKIDILPGHRVQRALEMLLGLSKLVSPRIWAATLRALCDGWTTHRRMQRSSPCLFGCGQGEDSIAHYSRCTMVARLMSSKLRLARQPPESRLAGFLLLEPCWRPGRESMLARRALGVYATFMASNRVRKGQAQNAEEVWMQYLKEGAASSQHLAAFLHEAWI
jgi:hypothetical protein